MLCPRCQLTLRPQDYEGQDVRFCDACWGYWMRREQLDAIVEDRTFQFSPRERKVVEREAHDSANQNWFDHESEIIACPECGESMNKAKYAQNCPIEIDECAEHGVWLDPGEVKELQVLLE